MKISDSQAKTIKAALESAFMLDGFGARLLEASLAQDIEQEKRLAAKIRTVRKKIVAAIKSLG